MGIYEEAKSIFQRENKRATQEIATLDVSFQIFAGKASAILKKATQNAADAIRKLYWERRIALREQNAALIKERIERKEQEREA
jgi:hypothetical protein